jgi:PAS domain S-box-containing protein
MDSNGRVACWNAGAERITGYADSDVVGWDYSMFYPSDALEGRQPGKNLEIARTEGRYEEECWQFRKDGSRFWSSGIVAALRDEAGQLRGFAKIMRDMTDRKLAAEASESFQRFVRKIVDVSPGVIYIEDLRQRKNVFINRAGETALGPAWSPLKRKREFILPFMHPADRQPFLEYLDRLAGLGDDEVADFEYRMRHNGEWSWFHSRDKVFSRNEDGSAKEIIGTATDITERKKGEEKNRFLAELNQALLRFSSPEELMAAAVRMLGEYLRVDRCVYSEIESSGERFLVMNEYTRGAMTAAVARYRAAEFGEREERTLRDNRVFVANDVEAESLDAADLSYRRANIRSLVCVPLIKSGNSASRMAVQQSTPRHWSNEEIDLVTTVAFRCRESIERLSAVTGLKESDERYRAFIANSSEGIWRFELDQPVSVKLSEEEQIDLLYKHAYLAECNDAFARMYGYDSADQVCGTRLGTLLPKSEPQNVACLQAFKRSGYHLMDAETAKVDSSGNRKYFVYNIIGIAEDGNIIRAWGTQRDITRRKRAEAELLESEERFAKAFRASPHALIISRISDGLILEVNDSFVALSGYDHSESIGRNALALNLYVDPTDRQRMKQRMIEHGRVRDFEFEMKRKSGEARLVSFSAESLELHGEHCWLTIGHDITEQRRVEKEREQLFLQERAARGEAEAANRMKDEFLATISHELRTPLTAIVGWAHMLNAGSLPPDQARHATEVVEQSAKAQARLIDAILDTSRNITGTLTLDIRPVEINRIFQAAVDVIRQVAEAKDINLQVGIEDRGSMVNGDANRLQQVITNLLSNAVKFTNEHGNIDARLRRRQDKIEISVSDDGIGIEAHFLPHVFDRFRQADSSSTRRFGGLGLGLAIVRNLVEMHGGTVSAESQGSDRGATFTIRVPVASPPRPPGRRADATNHIDAMSGRLQGMLLLVVEDDADTLEMLKALLESSGAAVVTAATVREALQALELWRPDVLISDLAMPGEDGYDLMRQVRSRSVRLGGNIPAVALSAYTTIEDRRRALTAGFQMHVPKPVAFEELVAAISNLAGTAPAR